MRHPNGYGSVKKLSGKRRKPFAVYITTGFERASNVPEIASLANFLSPEVFSLVEKEINAYKARESFKAKQVQKCIGYFATRQEALIALAEYNKKPYDIDRRNMTFKEVYEILYEEVFSKMQPSAKGSYISAFKKCSEIYDVKMADLRKAHMQAIVDNYSHYSKSLLENFIKLFHAVYKFALENDICEKNYSEFVTAKSEKVRQAKHAFSREEVATLWQNLSWEAPCGLKCVDAVLIDIYTGLRPSELLSIKKSDVHLAERWLDINGTKTKAAKRIVPIHKDILPLIEKRMQASGENLFTLKSGKSISIYHYRQNFFNEMCRAFGMEHTPHECRHTFATYAAASNLNKILVKKIIGHASQDLTEDVYTHAFTEDLIAEMNKYTI